MRARFGGGTSAVVRAVIGSTRSPRLSPSVTPSGSIEYIGAMKLEPFAMERMQSTYENEVAFNLSESGVHPLRLGDLVDDGASREALLEEPLRYTQSNGTIPLREAIANLYPGATPDHIQVTNGG